MFFRCLKSNHAMWCLMLSVVLAATAINSHAEAGDAALMNAITEGDASTVSALLSGGRGDAEDESAAEVVIKAMGENGDVNSTDDRGFTALHHAARYNQLALARRLIAKGANVNAASNSGMTPLMQATFPEQPAPALAELLIKKGADVNATNKRGATPLALAVLHGQPEIVKLLARGGADVNAVVDGELVSPMLKGDRFPLLYAALMKAALAKAERYGPTEQRGKAIVQILIAGRADANAKSSATGKTALQLARSANYSDIASLLLANGAADPDRR